MLLPARLPEKACGKVAGVLLGLAPALVCIGVGAAADPAEAGRLAATLFTSPPVWVLAAVYLLLVCLTGALSITVRWGAIPLAVGLTLFPLLMLILLDHPRPEPAEDAALAVPAACLLLLMSAAAVYAAGMQLNRTVGR
jgi:hypothetical protein